MNRFLAAVSLVVSAAPALADVALETNRANVQALPGADFIDWTAVGPQGSAPSNPFSTTSDGGLNVDVRKTLDGAFMRATEGSIWDGNFAAGDALLWTHGGRTTNEIRFSNFDGADLFAAGAQVQPESFGDFVARINLYDASGTVIRTFTSAGMSERGPDGSAIFIGVRGDVAFRSFGITLDSAAGNVGDFAINRLEFAAHPVSESDDRACPATITFQWTGSSTAEIRVLDYKSKQPLPTSPADLSAVAPNGTFTVLPGDDGTLGPKLRFEVYDSGKHKSTANFYVCKCKKGRRIDVGDEKHGLVVTGFTLPPASADGLARALDFRWDGKSGAELRARDEATGEVLPTSPASLTNVANGAVFTVLPGASGRLPLKIALDVIDPKKMDRKDSRKIYLNDCKHPLFVGEEFGDFTLVGITD